MVSARARNDAAMAIADAVGATDSDNSNGRIDACSDKMCHVARELGLTSIQAANGGTFDHVGCQHSHQAVQIAETLAWSLFHT